MHNYIINHKKIILIILTCLGILCIALFSYAFLTPELEKDEMVEFDVSGNSLDSLEVSHLETISITPGTQNLSDGYGNIYSETSATTTLKSHNPEVGVYAYYTVYFEIDKNGYSYSTEEKTAELILTVIDPDGNIVTNSSDLNYVTVNDVSGFDVTEEAGSINIVDNYRFESKSSVGVSKTWNFKLTMINLNSNQDINQNRNFEASIKFIVDDKAKLLNDSILEYYGGAEYIQNRDTPDFSDTTAVINDGMYASVDNYGTSYYLRNNNPVKYVYFGGFYWEVIRINGDGTIKLLYLGTDLISSTNIGLSQYNINTYGIAENVGYTYNPSLDNGNLIESQMKIFIDEWFENNLISYRHYLSDILFCNDRVAYTDAAGTNSVKATGTNTLYFAGYVRHSTKNYTFLCDRIEDSYTVEDEINGNGYLKYPIALITLDELAMNNYILSTVTMTPEMNYRYSNSMYDPKMYLYNNSYYSSDISSNFNVKPAINLKSDTLVIGSGTITDPYIVNNIYVS